MFFKTNQMKIFVIQTTYGAALTAAVTVICFFTIKFFDKLAM